MAWNLSSGMAAALLSGNRVGSDKYVSNTISFTDSTINDSADGLGSFVIGDWVRVGQGTNDEVVAKVIGANNSQLTFASGTFTAESSGSYICLEALRGGGGSIMDVFRGGTLHIFTGSRPANADSAEEGTLLLKITLNGSNFTPGVMTNGLNLGLDGGVLKRAIDPVTGSKEKWQGVGLADGTAGWGRWYANDVSTGASSTAIRMDGVVTQTAGGEIVMVAGRDIVTDGPASVTDVTFSIGSN